MAATHRFEATAWSNVLAAMAPALNVASGDSVVTVTLDAAGADFEGRTRASRPNPMNGPIHVEGAEPGDALRVDILRVDPARDTGWTRAALSATVIDPEAARDLPPRDLADWRIDRAARNVRLEVPEPGLENFVLPLAPMIGCFGVAPSGGQAISTASSDRNGGNMDWRGFGPGCSVSFPVSVSGALFFLGDCHAIQGCGEISGTGVETSCEVEVRLTVEKGRTIGWPRGETADRIFTIGNARPLDQALQHATTEMAARLREEYGLSDVAVAHLLGQTVLYEVGNVYNPAYTMVCGVEKRWLPESE